METTDKLVNIVVSKDAQSVEVGDGGLNLRLDLLEGWDDLDGRQQRYLARLAKSPNNPTLAAMQLGYKMSEVKRWNGQENFSLVYEAIQNVYTEVLKSVDYADAIGNSKIRARVIKARENSNNYTEKKEGSKHLHLHSSENLSDFINMLGD